MNGSNQDKQSTNERVTPTVEQLQLLIRVEKVGVSNDNRLRGVIDEWEAIRDKS